MKRTFSFPSLLSILLTILVFAPQVSAQDHSHHDGEHADHHVHMEAMDNAEIANPDVVLDVNGLHCEHCAYSLRRELDNLNAIVQTQVIVEDDQQICIALNEGQTLSEEDILEAVRASGFEDAFELKGVQFRKDEG